MKKLGRGSCLLLGRESDYGRSLLSTTAMNGQEACRSQESISIDMFEAKSSFFFPGIRIPSDEKLAANSKSETKGTREKRYGLGPLSTTQETGPDRSVYRFCFLLQRDLAEPIGNSSWHRTHRLYRRGSGHPFVYHRKRCQMGEGVFSST
jgi:hypothetical protein